MQYYKVKVTKLAESDLEEIGNYIAHELKNPIVALNTMQGIAQEIKLLEVFPKRNTLENDAVVTGLNIRRIKYKLSGNKMWVYQTYDLK